MKITLTSTTKIVTLDGVQARIWEGHSDAGVPVLCMITRISPRTHDAAALRQFEVELQECDPPSPEAAIIPTRLVL